MTLKIESVGSKNEDICKLVFDSDFTIYCIEAIKEALSQALNTHDSYEIDLSAVEEIDSSGIQLLIALKSELKKNEKPVTLSAVSDAAMSLMNTYGISKRLSGEET